MTSTVDVLAYIPSPPQGVWYVGPVALRAYALFIIVGIVVAIVWGDRRWVARGGEKGTVLDIAIWAVPFGLIGGRLYHVMTDWPTYFGEGGDPVDALKVWQGGLGIWGAVALGGVGAWIGCRRRGIPLPALGDAVAPAILLAQAIGRLGNYFNQELYGRETDVPWGLEIFERRNDAGQVSPQLIDGVSTGQVAFVVHPTFLYEALWNVLIVILLVWVDRRFRIGHGRLFALYVAGYCAGRFWIELMRSDHASLIAGVRVNSFTSALVFVAALVYFFAATKGREDPADLRPAGEGQAPGETADEKVEEGTKLEDEKVEEKSVSDEKAASTASAGGDAGTKTIDSKKDDAND
ncbi:MAG: prolipoprotein diacylglyceryl transferase [Rhodococcus sp. (in: high G+C Gram-positive bacteria)]|nr:MAG: prolipoprotein diacylglyceryl transferase [Rhodococcus sp. (in: high G+C Gram-positive bacteria)]